MWLSTWRWAYRYLDNSYNTETIAPIWRENLTADSICFKSENCELWGSVMFKDKYPSTFRAASSRSSVSWGEGRKNKKKTAQREEAKKRLWANQRSFRYSRIWYTLWLVNFRQILSTLERHWRTWDMRYGGGQRPFNKWRGVQICDKQHAQ